MPVEGQIIKWFKEEAYGFIDIPNRSNLFLHITNIDIPKEEIAVGDIVSCEEADIPPKGTQAVNAKLVRHIDPSAFKHGTVSYYKRNGEYGTIQIEGETHADGSSKEVRFYGDELPRGVRPKPRERVSFYEVPNHRDPAIRNKAINVAVIQSDSVKCEAESQPKEARSSVTSAPMGKTAAILPEGEILHSSNGRYGLAITNLHSEVSEFEFSCNRKITLIDVRSNTEICRSSEFCKVSVDPGLTRTINLVFRGLEAELIVASPKNRLIITKRLRFGRERS